MKGRGMHDVEWVLAAGLVLYIGLYTKNIKYVTKYLSVIYAFWVCYNRPYVLLFEPIFPYNVYFSREVLAGRTGPPRGPHAARGPQVGHPCCTLCTHYSISAPPTFQHWTFSLIETLLFFKSINQSFSHPFIHSSIHFFIAHAKK